MVEAATVAVTLNPRPTRVTPKDGIYFNVFLQTALRSGAPKQGVRTYNVRQKLDNYQVTQRNRILREVEFWSATEDNSGLRAIRVLNIQAMRRAPNRAK